jgi:peroxiredoxin
VKVSSLLLTALLAAMLALGPGEVAKLPILSSQDGNHTLTPLPPEPPSAQVDVGDRAPDFSFQGEDNRWRRLHDLLLTGPVLLVFGADPPALTAIEREREAMTKMGITPVAVIDARSRIVRATARRLDVHYLVIADSRRVIATQFNAVESGGERSAPAWFVVDKRGTVRALKRGTLPAQGYASRAATALGMPVPAALAPELSKP